jgi:hypothetical protein
MTAGAMAVYSRPDSSRPTAEQTIALFRIYKRRFAAEIYYWGWQGFRRRAYPGPGCLMIEWAGMVLGIEPDGYTHS